MRREYNGLPLFCVDFGDFSYIVECVMTGKRILTRNLADDALKEYFNAVRRANFAATYGGTVIIYGR